MGPGEPVGLYASCIQDFGGRFLRLLQDDSSVVDQVAVYELNSAWDAVLPTSFSTFEMSITMWFTASYLSIGGPNNMLFAIRSSTTEYYFQLWIGDGTLNLNWKTGNETITKEAPFDQYGLIQGTSDIRFATFIFKKNPSAKLIDAFLFVGGENVPPEDTIPDISAHSFSFAYNNDSISWSHQDPPYLAFGGQNSFTRQLEGSLWSMEVLPYQLTNEEIYIRHAQGIRWDITCLNATVTLDQGNSSVDLSPYASCTNAYQSGRGLATREMTQPSAGSVSDMVYTQNASFTGNTSFTYAIFNGLGNATLTIETIPTTGGPTRAPTSKSPTRAPSSKSPTRAPSSRSPTVIEVVNTAITTSTIATISSTSSFAGLAVVGVLVYIFF